MHNVHIHNDTFHKLWATVLVYIYTAYSFQYLVDEKCFGIIIAFVVSCADFEMNNTPMNE